MKQTIGSWSVLSFLAFATGCDSGVSTAPVPSGGDSASAALPALSQPASAEEVVAGKSAYRDDGTELVGTATNHGAIDLNAASLPTSPGFFSSISFSLSPSDVCSGSIVFGVGGTAICDSVYGDFVASNMGRDKTTTQMSLTAEKSEETYAAGYREVPNILKDDDGVWNSAEGCTAAGGANQTCTSVTFALRPTVDCGSTGTVVERIADCLADNPATATWDGATKGISGESTWKLVSRINAKEVWRDERTGLLWSDSDEAVTNWCVASGNKQSDDPSNLCNNASIQNQTNPVSACAEFNGAAPWWGDDYGLGTYSDLKGGMGLLTATKIRWRLPTKNDWMQAELNGARYVLPRMIQIFWSSTTQSNNRLNAASFNSRSGGFHNLHRNDGLDGAVRCVGR